ncbi:MAG: DUF177 domain-containing protein [Bryobacteraceae bacterium]
MYIGIRELELKKLFFDENFPADRIDWDVSQFSQTTPMHVGGSAELLNDTTSEIRVRGHIAAEMNMTCDRCLEPVQYPIDSDFDLVYRPVTKSDTPRDIEINDDEADIGFYEGSGIELAEIVREYVLLAMPMHQVCREDCKGICPRCGCNRNTEACSCSEQLPDERWTALKELRGVLRK